VRKNFNINELDRISIVGVGLLGGSVGLALQAAGFSGTRVGVGRRASSLDRALKADAVDETTRSITEGVTGAGLVVLCTPIGRFKPLLEQMAGALAPDTYVTDVASTKGYVVRLAHRILPKTVRFAGSHPMAGSEKTGVEFSRADLFERSLCLVTPISRTPKSTARWLRGFWESLGGHTLVLPPHRHDELLARVSHLPHAVATALVNLSARSAAIDLAGSGFADMTRIASGDPAMWTEIFGTNRSAMIKAVDQMLVELKRFRDRLDRDDERAILNWLDAAKTTRDGWISKRYSKRVWPG